jgi:pimeloyl-ACP methyl ester carboxylesterase
VRGRGTTVIAAALYFCAALLSTATLFGQTAISIPAAEGGPIGADVYGSGDRAVVLVHGGRFDRTSWKPQAKELAAAGFRVVAIDLRAGVENRAGRETPCLYDAPCLAKDVLAAVRYLRESGAKTISLVGGSLGGGAVAQAAVEAPAGEIDRLVLLAPMAIDHPEKIRGRKLFVVARQDASGSGALRLPGIRAQYDKASKPKELMLLDGPAHAQFLFETEQGPRLMREILRFLKAP